MHSLIHSSTHPFTISSILFTLSFNHSSILSSIHSYSFTISSFHLFTLSFTIQPSSSLHPLTLSLITISSIHSSVHSFIHPSIHLPFHSITILPSIHVHPSIHESFHPFTRSPIHLFTLSFTLSFINPSIHSPFHPSIYSLFIIITL